MYYTPTHDMYVIVYSSEQTVITPLLSINLFFCNRDSFCLLRGPNWNFKYNLG